MSAASARINFGSSYSKSAYKTSREMFCARGGEFSGVEGTPRESSRARTASLLSWVKIEDESVRRKRAVSAGENDKTEWNKHVQATSHQPQAPHNGRDSVSRVAWVRNVRVRTRAHSANSQREREEAREHTTRLRKIDPDHSRTYRKRWDQ
jgi:hypothetical protein